MTKGHERSNELPPPLPPETRTVGQLVAEAIRLYGRRFFPSLALGLGPALVGILLPSLAWLGQVAILATVGGLVATASFIGAVRIAADVRLERETVLVAAAGGILAFAPAPLLGSFLLLPGVAWLALVGLVVPVALIERRGLGDSFRRALALGRADYIHAVGSLATLVIISLLTTFMLFFLLRGQADAALVAAGFLSLLVISPLLFLGSALLYFDQEARLSKAAGELGSRPKPRRRRNADVHHADDAHRPGRADAEVESGAAPGGQP